ncbi:3'5'-cyclic nucleotide phosphodiesterase family protein [Histomonas meleagridis]|uniref:3'5'-cyclic nucleotide phosphodiesterase family protein n=1 Tax=Histomonas meleagridis TaxID=135588 RepID=UPI00355A1B94|nr:3'5'-cyclic nucleotide phosphodiesterase family protein [Histomonas meleagridis]KAH0804153.1 3'5'-cyclic nucleotide phosphodiesterase family protein [Histomonas meleagridis]
MSSRRTEVHNPNKPYSQNTKQTIKLNNTIKEDTEQSPTPNRTPPSSQKNTFLSNTRSSKFMTAAMNKVFGYDQQIDSFLEMTYSEPLHESVENLFLNALSAESVIFWQDIPSLQILYSEKLKKTAKHSDGIIGFTFFSRETKLVTDLSAHSEYNEEIDGPSTMPSIFFPLWDYTGSVCAIVQVSKKSFDDEDEEFISYFIQKFKIYSRWVEKSEIPAEVTQELIQVMETEQFLVLFKKRLTQLFDCKTAELWKFNQTANELFLANANKVVTNGCIGIIGESISNHSLINCQSSKLISSYNSEVDGDDDTSILVFSIIDPVKHIDYAIALRGKNNTPVFTLHDELLLTEITPYLAIAYSNAEQFSIKNEYKSNQDEHFYIDNLQNIINSIEENKETNEIVIEILEYMKNVTTSERCSLYLNDKKTNNLKSIYHTSCKSPIIVPYDKGIVGLTFRESEIYNIPDAYEDPSFDSSIDQETGYKTHTLLSIPIKTPYNKTIGVIQLLNKSNFKPFSKADINFSHVFSSLIGLILSIDKLRTKLKERTLNLNTIINPINGDDLKSILYNVIQSAKIVSQSENGTIFLVDEVFHLLTTYVVDGPKLPSTFPISHGVAAHSVETKKPIIVNDAYHDPLFNKTADLENGFKTRSILSIPIISSVGKVIGVLEMINKKNDNYNEEDIKLVQIFANIASFNLENNTNKKIAKYGKCEFEMEKLISETELDLYVTPKKLSITEQEKQSLVSLNFFCIEWNGIGLFKAAFFIFNNFGLLEKFKISNKLFFNFLFKLRETYNDVPYHNWIHAIDVLQYVSYQIITAKFYDILTSYELLSICIAAICHDANHKGLNNPYNEKAETPIGILYKEQSVMEMHHCAMTSYILSHDECNLLYNISESEVIKIYKNIFKLILATDMAHHFKLLKNANDIMDQGPINLSNESHRLMTMTMLIKVADISNVSRPFPIAEKWCDVLAEEFWRQGDLEIAHGWGPSSDLNNRAIKDKAKGQIGFYSFVCLPLYNAVGRMLPELQINADKVNENLEVWKERQREIDEGKKKETVNE